MQDGSQSRGIGPQIRPQTHDLDKIWNSWAAQYGTRPGGISVVAVVWTSAGPLRIPTQHHTDGHSVRHAKLQSCKAADLQTCSMLPWRTHCTLEKGSWPVAAVLPQDMA